MDSKDFEKELDFYFLNKRNRMREEYNRVLPSGELVFNRFEKADYLGFGKGSSIYDTSVVMGDVRVGDNTWIGPYTMLEGLNAKIEIGKFVSINTGVSVFTHDSTKYHVSGGVEPFEKGSVTIGDYSVIGTMSMITFGVTIGKHCVIGANSFVSKDIPDYSIAAGTPATVIGRVVINQDGKVHFQYF